MRGELRVLGTAAVTALLLTGSLEAQSQAQQPKELSEKSVATLMDYAWVVLPQKFTAPNGKTIEVDKKKRDALIPIDVAREVIKAGNLSAQAQLCDIMEAQIANYHALMARERSKNKWTDQQLLYITTLHRMTIHMAAGKMRVVEKGAEEVQVILEPIEPSKESCNDEKKKKVVDAVAAYVESAPKLQAQPGQPTAAPAAQQPAQPVPAAAKDKKDQKK